MLVKIKHRYKRYNIFGVKYLCNRKCFKKGISHASYIIKFSMCIQEYTGIWHCLRYAWISLYGQKLNEER